MIKSLKEKTNHFWDMRLIRFLIMGGVNTIFGYSMYSLFMILNFHYSVSLFIALILGIIFNFFTTGRIVFKNSSNHLIFQFFIVYGITYLINLGALRVFEYFNFNMFWAQLIMTLPIAFLGYYLNKKFVFRITKENDDPT
jgi:putative flippase GtrA